MRTLQAGGLLLLIAASTAAQTGAPPTRFDIPANADAFPQNTPQAALKSVVSAIEKGKVDYLTAHLIEPSFIDARIADRAAQLEPAADKTLRAVRQSQLNDPNIPRSRRLPDDPARFAQAVAAEAKRQAFLAVVADIRTNLTENPDKLLDLRKFLRTGTAAEAGDAVSFTLPEVKDRQVYLKKIGTRWFVEDRQIEPPAPAPKN